MKVDPIRETAFRSLRRITEKAAYANILVDATLERHNWAERDRKLYTTLVYGALRHQGLLDWALARRMGGKFPRGIDRRIVTILRMGMYQILFLNRVPKYAAVNESVKLAKRFGHKGSAGLVNAVLRATKRNASFLELPDREDDPAFYIATKYSHPLWLVKRWLTMWGADQTERVCAANNEIAPLTVRANTLKVALEEFGQHLRTEQVSARKNTEVPEELEIVKSPCPVRRLPSFREGLFTIQDASSICAGHLLDPRPEQAVVDMCAGPGGKTTHLAQLMQNHGTIYAIDVKPHRISLIRENCRTLGVTIVRCVQGDASRISELNVPLADRVLVDAPCSGTGTFRRRVDLKWRLKAEDIVRLVGIQKELMAAAASVLKPGGVLVYSVCSVDIEETDEIADGCAHGQRGLVLDSGCPAWMLPFKTSQGYFRIMPGQMAMDGFFMAKFLKQD